MFVQLRTSYDNEIWIEADKVCAVEPVKQGEGYSPTLNEKPREGDFCMIYIHDELSFEVVGSIDEVVKKIMRWKMR